MGGYVRYNRRQRQRQRTEKRDHKGLGDLSICMQWISLAEGNVSVLCCAVTSRSKYDTQNQMGKKSYFSSELPSERYE